MRELIRKPLVAAALLCALMPTLARGGNQLEEKMSDSVRAALHKAVSDQSAPFLAFASHTEARSSPYITKPSAPDSIRKWCWA